MSWFLVDVESDGPVPGLHSLVCFGVVKLTRNLKTTPIFYSGLIAPISSTHVPEALAVSGFSREQHEAATQTPKQAMENLNRFLGDNSSGKPVFVADNPAYDFPWINYYFYTTIGRNPFGHSGRRIGDLFCGFMRDSFYQWKKHRITQHDHNPVNDCLGNAEALLYLKDRGCIIPTR